ncbi:MAG: gliding motility lipoprotein GldH [Maribacter sp.]|nr:MAG: gliding motility lipoprotein GldH [Maribacter sp.]
MHRTLIALVALLGMVSCDTSMVRSEYQATDNGAWNKDNIMEFTFSEMDSLQHYDMFINLRNDGTFPYNNLFLIAELNTPNGDIVTDTLEYEMALPDGQWLGKGYGSIKENKLWYKENIVFSSSGVYTLRLSHAMRKNGSVDGVINLDGVTDVGFEIIKSKQ